MGPMIQQIHSICKKCNGKGFELKKSDFCSHCDRKGFHIKKTNIELPLRNGITNNCNIKFENQGHFYFNKKTDLIINIKFKKHPIYEVKNEHLFTIIHLDYYESIFGFCKKLKFLNNNFIYIQNTTQILENQKKIIKNIGFNNLKYNKKGDLIILFKIKPFYIKK